MTTLDLHALARAGILAACIAGCSSPAPTTPAAPASLFSVSDEAPGDHCRNGGQRIEIGVDDGSGEGIARDGVLQPGEVTRTSYVCGGEVPSLVVEAGAAQTVSETESLVTLTGTAEGATSFSWSQLSGPRVSLSAPTAAVTTFAPPDVKSDESLVFELAAADATRVGLARTTVVITFVNQPPTAHAGPDSTVLGGERIALRGGGADPDGQPLTYLWRQTAGPSAALVGEDQPVLELSAPVQDAEATLDFELTVSDGTLEAKDSVSVVVAAPVRVVSFAAGASSVDPGTATTLSWSVINATDCILDPGGFSPELPTGSVSVAPEATTRYTLSCNGEGGPAVAHALVRVGVAIVSFEARPTLLYTGGPGSTLSWTTLAATSCDIEPNVGALARGELPSGWRTVLPAVGTTYTLNCSGDVGTATRSATVDVQRVWYVNGSTGVGAASGTNWANASAGFSGLTELKSGDQVWVRATRIKPANMSTPALTTVAGVRYYGGFNGTEAAPEQRVQPIVHTLLDGAQLDAKGAAASILVAAEGGTAPNPTVLDGFALIGSRGTKAAMVATNDVELDNCLFDSNVDTLGRGGALEHATSGTLTVRRSVFSRNSAAFEGGAIYTGASTDLQVFESTFTGNGAGGEGAAILSRGRLTVRDSDFLGNTGGNKGSVVSGVATTDLVANTLFQGNTAALAILDLRGGTVVGSTFTGNSNNSGALDLVRVGSAFNLMSWANSPAGARVNASASVLNSCFEGCLGPTCTDRSNTTLGLFGGAPPAGSSHLTGAFLSHAGVSGAVFSTPCIDRGSEQPAEQAKIPWQETSTRADGAADAPPIDPGIHR